VTWRTRTGRQQQVVYTVMVVVLVVLVLPTFMQFRSYNVVSHIRFHDPTVTTSASSWPSTIGGNRNHNSKNNASDWFRRSRPRRRRSSWTSTTNITKDDTNKTDDDTTNTTTVEDSDDEEFLYSTSPIMTPQRTQFLDRIAMLASSIVTRREMTMMSTTTTNSSISSSRIRSMDQNVTALNEMYHKDENEDGITTQSDMTLPQRHFHIVTTASLPWFTGTAVNPLLRAAYLHRYTQQQQKNINHHNQDVNSTVAPPTLTSPQRYVTLVIPWLELKEDQILLYNGRQFHNRSEQEQYIRDWLRYEANMSDVACSITGLQILFYPGRYHPGLGSIFAMGDIIDTIVHPTSSSNYDDDEEDGDTATSNNNNKDIISLSSTVPVHNHSTAISQQQQQQQQPSSLSPSPILDICILEEPEHCNWYRAPGDGWTKRFQYVVGIVHTSTCYVYLCACLFIVVVRVMKLLIFIWIPSFPASG
jgi:hypothetical protein